MLRQGNQEDFDEVDFIKDEELVNNLILLLTPPVPQSASQNTTSSFFSRPDVERLTRDPAKLICKIREIALEIDRLKTSVLPGLDNSPCNIHHLLFKLPQDIQPDDVSIQALRSTCVQTKNLLNSLKYSRDGMFVTGKISGTLGLLMLIASPSLGMELILFSLCVAAIILYIDKFMHNNEQKRDHFFPTREDIFSTPRYNILIKKYTLLEKLCDAWFNLGQEVRDNCDNIASLTVNEQLMDKRLQLELASPGMK